MFPPGSHVVPEDNRPRDERRFADREHWLLVTNWHPSRLSDSPEKMQCFYHRRPEDNARERR